MEVVVTGSAGFIGSHLVGKLIGRGYRVLGIDRQPGRSRPGYLHRVLDLAEDRSISGLDGLIDDAELVFHLAARPGVRGVGPDVESRRRRDNIVATRNLLAAMPIPATLVATSSSSVYGGSIDGIPSRESDPLRPNGGYALSKVAMERLCEQRRSLGGTTAVVRPFTVAGERQRVDMAFSIWLDALRRGRPIEIFGSGSRSRDITDVRDVVEGLIRAGERQVNGIVNLGTGTAHRLIDMARILLEVTGEQAEIMSQPVPAEDVHATLADTTRCRRVLGFVPATDLTELVARQVEATERRSSLVAL